MSFHFKALKDPFTRRLDYQPLFQERSTHSSLKSLSLKRLKRNQALITWIKTWRKFCSLGRNCLKTKLEFQCDLNFYYILGRLISQNDKKCSVTILFCMLFFQGVQWWFLVHIQCTLHFVETIFVIMWLWMSLQKRCSRQSSTIFGLEAT